MGKKYFESKIGKKFTVKLDTDVTTDLELISVDPLKKNEGVEKGREEPFSLVFSGAKDKHLSDNTYTMAVENEEERNIFISAFAEDEKGILYDAVFN